MDPSTNHRSAEIYLDVRGDQIAFLSIPESDILRLSTRPFKWMRFVCFSICGARGDLSAALNGPPVNYESPSLLDHDRYYYKTSDEFTFVDPDCLNDRKTTSSASSGRRGDFRRDIKEQAGGCCVFTGKPEDCEAAHLIPFAKGDVYIAKVISNRTRCYDATSPTILDINATENGIFLYSPLHKQFSRGAVTFLQTPNFAMVPTDIPRLERRSPRADCITLHQLEKQPEYNSDMVRLILDEAAGGRLHPSLACTAGLNVDALFSPTAEHLPPAIILDFVYGVAAYKRWASKPFRDLLTEFKDYKSIPVLPPPPQERNSSNEGTPDRGGDNNDPDYVPSKKAKREHLSKKRNVMADAMDEMNLAMMFLSGITPQEVIRRQDERMEEEERTAQEAGRTKVMEWMETIPATTHSVSHAS